MAFSADSPPLDLEPIVVLRSKTHLLNSYYLESDAIDNLFFNSLVEALNFLPLDLQSRSLKSGIQTDFSLRGSSFQGVLILIDGQRVNDPQTAHHNSDLPVTQEDIRRIEVIPGLGSSLFGPDAIAGAINIMLKKPQEKKVVLQTSFGQYQKKLGLFSISEKKGDCGVRLSLEEQESNGFYEDTDFKKFTSTIYCDLEVPYGEFDFSLGYQEKEFGAYDFYTPGMGYLSKEWTKTYLLSTGLKLDNEGFIIKPNFLWRRHFDKFMLDKTQLRSQYLNHHRTDIYTPNIYFQKQTNILGKIGLGSEYGTERISSTNLGKHSRNHKSLFMDSNKDLISDLTLGLSFRIDDYGGFDEAYTGSLSFRYEVSQKGSLHFGISRSIRVPSFTELYYNDPTTIGDSALSAEKSINYQVGYNYKQEGFATGITLFIREEDDMIDWIKRTASQEKWQAENITEAEAKGIESHLKLYINQNLALDSNYSYVDKRINDRGYLYKYGPNYFRHLVNANLTFNLPLGIQTISSTYKKRPRRDGWFILNACLSYNLNKNLRLFLNATNLMNIEYQEIEGIPQPGRWVELGLRAQW